MACSAVEEPGSSSGAWRSRCWDSPSAAAMTMKEEWGFPTHGLNDSDSGCSNAYKFRSVGVHYVCKGRLSYCWFYCVKQMIQPTFLDNTYIFSLIYLKIENNIFSRSFIFMYELYCMVLVDLSIRSVYTTLYILMYILLDSYYINVG